MRKLGRGSTLRQRNASLNLGFRLGRATPYKVMDSRDQILSVYGFTT